MNAVQPRSAGAVFLFICVQFSDRMENQVLIIGYGNTYCRDDGVALYVLNAIRKRANLNILQPDEDGLDELGHPIDTIMVHQLIPELAPSLASYQKVLFVDAHKGTIPEEVRIVPVQEEYGFHAVTHHMSPGMLLTLARQNNGFAPPGFLISVKGEDFDFGLGISDSCRSHADMAIDRMLALLE